MPPKTQEKDQNEIRKQFWMDVYVAYVGSHNTVRKDAAKEYADLALKAFDERFSNQK